MKTSLQAVLASAVLLAAVNAGASTLFEDMADFKQPNIKIGQLKLDPYYQFKEEYDNNIYLVPKTQNGVTTGGGVVGSWITHNVGGLNLDLPLNTLHHFSGNYEAEEQNYSKQFQANTNFRQKASGQYAYQGAYGIGATAGDAYVNTTDPAFSELNTRAKRWENTANAAVSYSPERSWFTGAVDYMDRVDKYLDPTLANLLNRNEQSVGLKAGYKVQPQTDVYVAYHRDVIHYSVVPVPGGIDRDSKAHNVDLGVEGQILPKLTGTVQVGGTYRKYDQNVAGSNSNVTRDWTAGVNLVYKPLERTDISLTVFRALQESITGINGFYVANDAQLNVTHRFPYKLTGTAFGGISIDRYQAADTVGTFTAVRRDDIYQGGASLKYDVQQWLALTGSFQHTQRNSTFTQQFNYSDERTALGVAVTF